MSDPFSAGLSRGVYGGGSKAFQLDRPTLMIAAGEGSSSSSFEDEENEEKLFFLLESNE